MKHLFSTFESGNNKNDNDGEDSDIDEHETTKDPLDEGQCVQSYFSTCS